MSIILQNPVIIACYSLKVGADMLNVVPLYT